MTPTSGISPHPPPPTTLLGSPPPLVYLVTNPVQDVKTTTTCRARARRMKSFKFEKSTRVSDYEWSRSLPRVPPRGWRGHGEPWRDHEIGPDLLLFRCITVSRPAELQYLYHASR
ncbi:hypothetical protein J6590_097257 [Homalodisca vitripennis]|nr:hypothetical protein J6590_054019 [Homalodisca vitripennis]KAG8294694.1 hypothetical protein J6590_097257 [Homalodisca vitripennis]